MRQLEEIAICPQCSFQSDDLAELSEETCPNCGAELEIRVND